jgi:hypothetical protein
MKRWVTAASNKHRQGRISELLAVIVILTSTVVIAAEIEERTIQTEGEKFSISVPKEWPAIETRRAPGGKPYFRLGPANTNFSFQLYFNERLPNATNAPIEKRMERFVEAALKPLVENSVEGKLQFHRFGTEKDAVYARLTDRAPKAGEYLFYTRGMRLVGTNVLGFELVSNDRDFLALSNTLAVVESVKTLKR